MEKLELGKLIRTHRIKMGLTQKQLAEKLEKAESSIRMWELGKNKPTPEVINQLSEALDVPYLELMKTADYLNSNNIEELQKMNTEYFLMDMAIQEELKKVELKLQDLIDEDENNINSEIAEKLENHMKSLLSLLEKYRYFRVSNQFEIEKIKFPMGYKNEEKDLLEITLGKSDNSLELENLFKLEQEISLNGKILSKDEKERALNILKLTFDTNN